MLYVYVQITELLCLPANVYYFYSKNDIISVFFSRGSLQIRSTVLSNNNYYHYSFARATDDRMTRRERGGGVTKESFTRIIITQLYSYTSIYMPYCTSVLCNVQTYCRACYTGGFTDHAHRHIFVITMDEKYFDF